MRSDLAAKQYAGRNGYNGIKIDGEDRHYILSQAEGRRWLGPYGENEWLHIYLGLGEV